MRLCEMGQLSIEAANHGDGHSSHSQRKYHLVSVIVPTLNEVDNIDIVLDAIIREQTPALKLEVLIADGGSTDGTIEKVRHWEQRANVRLVRCDGSKGLAGDVLHASTKATGETIVVMDADLSHPADRIPALVQPVLDGLADMVVGSRYVEGGETPGWPRHRRLLSRFGSLLAAPLTNLKDPLSGFFALKRDLLNLVDPTTTGFKIGLEAIATGGSRLKVLEVPISFIDRSHGHSKIGVRQIFAYIYRLLVLLSRRPAVQRLTRVCVIGSVGVIVDLLIFSALRAAGLPGSMAVILSFLAATISNFLFANVWLGNRTIATRRRWLSIFPLYFAITTLAFGMRAGVFSTLTLAAWIPDTLALGVAIATASGVSLCSYALFFHNAERAATQIWPITAGAAAAYVIALRLVFMAPVDLIPQEAYYWNYAQHLDIGYLDHPPMVAWLIWVGTKLFGDNEFGVRVLATVCWIVATFFSYRFTEDLYGQAAARMAALLLATLPFYFAVGLVMTPDAPLTAAWAGALFFLYRALVKEDKQAWYGAGAFVGFGLLSKYTIALLGPATVVFILWDQRARLWLKQPQAYLGACLALIVFSPVVYWNLQNAFQSFAFQTADRIDENPRFELPYLVVNMLGLLTPIGLLATVYAVWKEARMLRCKGSAIKVRRARFTLVFTGVPLFVFAVASFLGDTKLNWTGPVWLCGIPAVAGLLSQLPKDKRFVIPLQRLAGLTIAFALCLYAVVLSFIALGPVFPNGVRLPKKPVAWTEFGQLVDMLSNRVKDETGQSPLLIGMDKYNLASQLAFYAHDVNYASLSVGRGILDMPSLMYERWYKVDNYLGRTAILISFNRADIEASNVLCRFAMLGTAKEQSVTKNGQQAGVFWYRTGHGLRSHCAYD